MKTSKILLDKGVAEGNPRDAADRMAREVLSNPVIEDYRVEIEQ